MVEDLNVDREQLQSVRKSAVSKDGYEFDPASLRWQLSRDVAAYISWGPELLDQTMLNSFLSVLRVYAENASAHYAKNLCDRFRVFAEFAAESKGIISSVDAFDIVNYRSYLERDKEWYLGALSGFLKKWHDLGYTGVDSEVVWLLNSWRLKGNQKGKAVQTLCPYEGALSDLEYEALEQALVSAFEQDEIDLENFVLVSLFMATGRRPAQIADLKIRDLVEAVSSDGLREFVLRVPRRKQYGGGWREQFHDYALSPELGAQVSTLISRTRRVFECDLGPCSAIDELAIFPSWTRLEEIWDGNLAHLNEVLPNQWIHRNPSTLSNDLKRIVNGIEVYSERTGEALNVFPTRLRRTLGTRAAREGYGQLTIAELLDHSDSQNAGVYTENVPEHVDAIDRAVAEQLAPIAQAFSGVLVDQEPEANRGEDLTSRIRSSESGSGVGTCGHYGFCGALAPIACYTCRHFQPWLDGPHEEVRDDLIAQREAIKNRTGDMTMAAVNDRTIFAVEQVVQLCNQRKDECM